MLPDFYTISWHRSPDEQRCMLDVGLLDTPKFDTFYRVFKKLLKIKGRANLLAFYLLEHPWGFLL